MLVKASHSLDHPFLMHHIHHIMVLANLKNTCYRWIKVYLSFRVTAYMCCAITKTDIYLAYLRSALAAHVSRRSI